MKKVQLVNAANEFNSVVKLQEPIKTKGVQPEVLAKSLFDALSYREPGDKFSAKTEKIFKKLKKQFKDNTVNVGDTVEFEVTDTKTNKVMSKKEKAGKGSKNVEIIAAILNPQVKKDELVDLIENQKVFKKVKDDLLEVKNFMSLKKAMLEVFDEAEVAEVKEAMPKVERKPKAKKEPKVDPIVAEIEGAEDVDELKAIAKADDRFNWKELKALKKAKKIRKAMLAEVESSKPAPKAKAEPKMVENPLIAEINEFTKTKKLKAWAAEKDEFAEVKIKKSMDIEDAKAALIEVIPAEVKQKRKSAGGGKVGIVAAIVEMVTTADKKEGISRDDIHKKLVKMFPDRDASAMRNTVNTQVPGRIHRERFEVKKLKNGNFCKAKVKK